MASTITVKDAATGQLKEVLVDAVTSTDGETLATPVNAELTKLVHGPSGTANAISPESPIPTTPFAAAATVDRVANVTFNTTPQTALAAIVVGSPAAVETDIANNDQTAILGVRLGDPTGLTIANADYVLFPGDTLEDKSWPGAWSIVSDTTNPDVRISRKRSA